MAQKPISDSTKVCCPLCGAEYDRRACRHQACPMADHCQLLCCPYCGYKTVDTETSAAARWLQRLLHGERGGAAHGQK